MKIIMPTMMGNICLKDERLAENVRAAVTPREEREIEVRTIMSKQVRDNYKVTTPYGKAYIKNYADVCKKKAFTDYIFRSVPKKEILFTTVD